MHIIINYWLTHNKELISPPSNSDKDILVSSPPWSECWPGWVLTPPWYKWWTENNNRRVETQQAWVQRLEMYKVTVSQITISRRKLNRNISASVNCCLFGCSGSSAGEYQFNWGSSNHQWGVSGYNKNFLSEEMSSINNPRLEQRHAEHSPSHTSGNHKHVEGSVIHLYNKI